MAVLLERKNNNNSKDGYFVRLNFNVDTYVDSRKELA